MPTRKVTRRPARGITPGTRLAYHWYVTPELAQEEGLSQTALRMAREDVFKRPVKGGLVKIAGQRVRQVESMESFIRGKVLIVVDFTFG